jgi:hypothetical protein
MEEVMPEKTLVRCSDRFNYGCTFTMEIEDEEELSSGFYKKDGYYLNTCKECYKKNKRDHYKKNRRKILNDKDYGYQTIYSFHYDNNKDNY